MREPSLRASRLAIAGGVIGAAALAVAGFLLGRLSAPMDVTPPPPAPIASASAPPVLAPPQMLRRADLIAIGERASAAFVAGSPADAADGDIAGRRFELVIPFGCKGPQDDASGAPLRWRYDESAQTLRIHVAPSRWTAADWGLPDVASAPVEGEGFWISRPWNPAETCPKIAAPALALASDAAPAVSPVPAPVARPIAGAVRAIPAERSLAVAGFRAADARRDSASRPYAIVRRMAPTAFAPASGFHLRLSGRIDRFSNGASTQCVQPAAIDQRPACVIAVALDEVAIENPLDAAVLAAWSLKPDSRRAP